MCKKYILKNNRYCIFKYSLNKFFEIQLISYKFNYFFYIFKLFKIKNNFYKIKKYYFNIFFK